MNKQEAADFLGVEPRTLERYVKQGLIGVRYEKGKTRPVPVYDDGELQEFKAKQEQPTYRGAVERMEPITTGADNSDNSLSSSLSLLRDPAQAEAFTGIMATAIAQALATEQARQTDKFLTLDDAAAMIGVSRRVLDKFTRGKDALLQTYQGLGRGKRVLQSDALKIRDHIKNSDNWRQQAGKQMSQAVAISADDPKL